MNIQVQAIYLQISKVTTILDAEDDQNRYVVQK